MSKFYTYIVRGCDNTLYTGYTTDLSRRVDEHNGIGKNPGAKATRMKRPVKLVYFECFDSKQEAMSREWHIKKLSKKQKEKMIEENTLMKVVLASGSPRRKELLSQVGIDFIVSPADVDETTDLTDPAEVVTYLSKIKAEAVAEFNPNQVILAADTVVACHGCILGKPSDKKDAYNMLKMLSGKTHQVFTGVTIISAEGVVNSFFESTDVTMFDNDDSIINAYIATNEPMDKAGAYGIQGKGAILVSSIAGDYNNVVGLPVSMVYKELLKLNW